MGIGEKLRKRRQDLELSRNQLAEIIHVTPSAIANYENGVSYPKPDILISLIIALEVDANYLYQDYLSNSKIRTLYGQELTDDEIDAITKYRALSEHGKYLVRMIINEEYDRNRSEEWVEFSCIQPGVRKLHAGFLLQKTKQKIRLKKKHMIENMEFCFQIQADQYQPVFKKHDILALQRTAAEHNEMGLFYLNGVYYIRSLYQTAEVCRLCALNVEDPDIDILPSDDFKCIGKILGHLYGTYELVQSPDSE